MIMTLRLDENVSEKELADLLDGAVSYLDRLVKEKVILINALDTEEYEVLYSGLGDVFEGLQWLNRMLQKLGEVSDLNYETLLVGNTKETALQVIGKFNSFLQELSNCLQNRDYILLGDMLQYEFDERIREYRQIFIEIDSRLRNQVH